MPWLFDEVAPKTCERIFFHKDIYDRLKRMSNDNSIPHVIFHGAPGAGKKTMIRIFWRHSIGVARHNSLFCFLDKLRTGTRKGIGKYCQNDQHKHTILVNYQ